MKMSEQIHKEQVAKDLLYESIKDGRKRSLKVIGSCMHPVIQPGDEVFFGKREKFRFGDLVVYRQSQGFIVHRFIRKAKVNNKLVFILKADNPSELEEFIGQDEIIGVVTKLRRNGRILIIDTFAGRLTSLFYFCLANLNLAQSRLKQRHELLAIKALPARLKSIISTKVFNLKDVFAFGIVETEQDSFLKERKTLKLVAKDSLCKDEETQLIDLLKNGLDWQYVLERIKWNFIIPFYIQKLKSFGWEEDLYRRNHCLDLENIHRLQLIQDTKNRLILDRVLEEFNKHAIKVLVLKGAHLGIEVYEDSSQRWMGDIDLILRIEDWHKACKILNDLGFVLDWFCKDYNIWSIRYLDNHIDFRKQGIKLELKTGIWAIDFPYFNYSLWQDARSKRIGKADIYFPSYEDTLLIACVNLIRHNFSGLIWFLDIKKIVDKFKDALDWDVFLEKAFKYDLGTAVYYGLYLTDKLFSLTLSPDLLSKFKPPRFADKLFNFFWDRKVILLEKEGLAFKNKVPFECAFVLFCGKFSFRPKKFARYLIYLLKLIFPPQDFIRDKYKIKVNLVSLSRCYLIRLFSFLSTLFSSFFDLFADKDR
ncbi:MAG: nucleotidyltransferase family protein [Candidatus Omnitrophota bacterium]